MKKRGVLTAALFLTLLGLGPMADWAAGSQPVGLVTQMIEACEGHQLDDSVALYLGRGKTVEASCQDYGGQLLAVPNQLLKNEKSFPVIDTGQSVCYDNGGEEMVCPEQGEDLFGQDAQHTGNQFSFTVNGNGTVIDNTTGLIWQQVPSERPYSWAEAQGYCTSLSVGNSDDWHTPSVKELISISDFTSGWPYINTQYFVLANTPEEKQQQYWSSNHYEVGTTHGGAPSAFGINHGTGHIKAYPDGSDGSPMAAKFVRCVQGQGYGVNKFVDNNNGTITDKATGLMWAQGDSYIGLNWEEALDWAEQMNSVNYLGYHDWRLPNVKELQSIADYSGGYPAIDSTYFYLTDDDAYFWSSTSAYFSPANPGYYYAWYVAFGYAVDAEGEDLHGAGAVRFDSKVQGNPDGEDPERIYNYVRLVRTADKRLKSHTALQ